MQGMIQYYTVITILSIFTLFVLSILIWENDRIRHSSKWTFYLTYGLIAFSAIAEWLGLLLNGNPGAPIWAIRFVKFLDYTATPLAGGALVIHMRDKTFVKYILGGVLIANVIFQIVSAFSGWMVVVDEQHFYSHGPLYFVYTIFYFLVIALVIIEYVLYGRKFRRQNRLSLYFIILFLIVGICMQEFFGLNVRTVYISMTISAVLLFVHFIEFKQISMDDQIQQQQSKIDTDFLTGVYSRAAYSDALKFYEENQIPKNLAVFLIDINGLKKVNDSFGHEAGDELICGASECIKDTYGHDGRIYRIGGDEFVVFKKMDKNDALLSIGDLHSRTSEWRGKYYDNLSVSAGCALAIEYPNLTVEELMKIADREMYRAKTEYYIKNGLDRRRY